MPNPSELSEEAVTDWLLAKFSHRLKIPKSEIDTDRLFPDFGLDSTEVLVLAGELEDWIGFEMMPTAMWYHPTIGKLSRYIAEEAARAE